ncbi:MAG: hypothetical protein BAJATHORv1_10587 [Candidatus Thorarchaeota archaeon]|nr:MAG: hypothetical protein BAJATHORv1_10587 [Candidatus Thorarchaeota archaeon]
MCFGTAAHFLEEDLTKAWEVESEIRQTTLYGKSSTTMRKAICPTKAWVQVLARAPAGLTLWRKN